MIYLYKGYTITTHDNHWAVNIFKKGEARLISTSLKNAKDLINKLTTNKGQ